MFLKLSLPSEEYGEKGDKGRPSPDVGQHDGHFFARDFHWVHERLRDGVIAIDTDAAQVQNGDGAAIDVEAVPDITYRANAGKSDQIRLLSPGLLL